MEDTLLVSPAPHVRSAVNTRRIMLDVVIALIPTLIASAIIFGFRALGVTALCVAVCVISEWAFEKLCKRDVTVGDLSAVVTGILLAFNLPSTIPLWQAAFGSIVAIVVVKQLFGGIGRNFANPAITARVVLLISFAGSMSSFKDPINDAVSGATPLAIMGANGNMPSLLDMFLGRHGGSLGETCALTLLIGGIYLVARKVITWHTPVVFMGTVFLFTLALGEDPMYHLLAGGLILGAVFMATDYSTSPSTSWGKVVFGVGCGIITVLIRVFGNYPEGVSFAILLMNIVTPYINALTRRRPFGAAKKTKKA
ncbi:MAG: RnfABCDGE type electron transport complex subunit D [Ruminococcaceae bacterium]|nr:RnfABCDGE type electron transport complex subunit D [Oscillospiraceae bacterium]